MLQAGSKGDYTLMVGVPRGSRIIGVGANTVNPSQEPGASMSTDGAGDGKFSIPARASDRRDRWHDAGMDAPGRGRRHISRVQLVREKSDPGDLAPRADHALAASNSATE